MRRGIEKLAYLIELDPGENVTVGQFAEAYGETTERIIDAIDVLKIRDGMPTQIPPVPWPNEPLKLECPWLHATQPCAYTFEGASAGPELILHIKMAHTNPLRGLVSASRVRA